MFTLVWKIVTLQTMIAPTLNSYKKYSNYLEILPNLIYFESQQKTKVD